jgi:hypothetical protein
MPEWLRKYWLRNNASAFEATPQVPVDFFGPQPHKTSTYLYGLGFFGDGVGAQFALGEALNLAGMLRMLTKKSVLTDQEKEIAEDLLEDLPKKSRGSKRLEWLIENPPSADKALEYTKNIGVGPDRFVSFFSLGLLGNARRAARAWSDVIAFEQLTFAVKELPQEGNKNKNVTGHIAGGPMADEEHAHLKSAIFTIENPAMLNSLLAARRSFVLAAAEKLAANPNKRFSLTEAAAQAGYIKDNQDNALPYLEARLIGDTILLAKNAHHLRFITQAIPQALPPLAAAATATEIETFRTQLHDASEAMLKVTLPAEKIGKRADYELRADTQSGLHAVMAEVRQARQSVSDLGFRLATEAHDFSKIIKGASTLTPEQTATAESLREKLSNFRMLSEQLAAANYDLAYNIATQLQARPALANTAIHTVSQKLASGLEAHYRNTMPPEGVDVVPHIQNLGRAAASGDFSILRPAKTPSVANDTQPVVQVAQNEAVSIEKQGPLPVSTADETRKAADKQKAAIIA